MSRIWTLCAGVVTVAAWLVALLHLLPVVGQTLRHHEYGASTAAITYGVLITTLVSGSLVYLSARYGYARRLLTHRPASAAELTAFRDSPVPSVTILVPSYKEARAVVWKTVLSAALQDYPRRSVVLLIDDPPLPMTREDARALDDMRKLAGAVERELAAIRTRLHTAIAAFEQRAERHLSTIVDEARALAACHREVAVWFADQARRHRAQDHTDAVFVEATFLGPSRKHRERAEELSRCTQAGPPEAGALRREYRALSSRFDVRVRSFERKQYANLSHEPNKAMNLNAYLGLMGGHFRERVDGPRRLLERVEAARHGLAFEDSDFVVVLDADTVLHPEYVLTLAHTLSRPEHQRVAVVQTPYSAFPGAEGSLERVAGATTDIQYQVHQGFTYFGATFWVGANAMIRKSALEELAEVRDERGFPVRVFIHDRTVIEDTESTVDLRRRGWQLYNYPERMAFSATPPDFGALLIQRRRWANGGLLILPKLWRFFTARRRSGLREALLRLHYLTSLAVANVALLLLLGLAFDERLASLWLPVTAAPYYLLYAVDLRTFGYRRRDVLRVYALNLLLIPVSLGGVLGSLRQACTGRRSAFGRTPKVVGRTAVPAGYVLAEMLLLAWWAFGAAMEVHDRHVLNALFALGNAGFLLYALVRFVGVREAADDVRPLLARFAQGVATLRPAAAARGLLVMGVLALTLLAPRAAAGMELAITIDDLPTHGPLPPGTTRMAVAQQIIEVLRRHGVPGVIGFTNGGQVADSPEHGKILERWSAAGYTLGNHTLGHVDLHQAGVARFVEDLERNEVMMARYTDVHADRTFRYPYLHEGATLEQRHAVRRMLQRRGYQIVPVTVDFYDWAWNDAYARCAGRPDGVEQLARGFREAALRALQWSGETAQTLVGRPIRQILLLHLGAFDAIALDDLLSTFEARGVRFIPVRDALEDPVYGIDPDVTWRGQESFLLQLLRATGRPLPLPANRPTACDPR